MRKEIKIRLLPDTIRALDKHKTISRSALMREIIEGYIDFIENDEETIAEKERLSQAHEEWRKELRLRLYKRILSQRKTQPLNPQTLHAQC